MAYDSFTTAPALLLLRSNGDSVRRVRYPNLPCCSGDPITGERPYGWLWNSQLARNGHLLGTATHESIDPNRVNGPYFFEADTLGNFTKYRAYSLPPGYSYLNTWGSSFAYLGANQRIVELPDGYLLTYNPARRDGPFDNVPDAALLRLDARGGIRKSWTSWSPGPEELQHIAPAPDGSYLAIGNNIFGGLNHTAGAGSDYWLVRFSARGDTLQTRILGTDGLYENGSRWRATPDGGFVFVGRSDQPGLSGAIERQAEIVKVDSALRLQWRRPVTSDVYEIFGNLELSDVMPTTDGGYLALGWHWIDISPPLPYPGRTQHGLLVRLNAAGQIQWQQSYEPPVPPVPGPLLQLGGRFNDWSYDADGTALLVGSAFWTRAPDGDTTYWGNWTLRFTGLAPPWQPDLCARRPAAPRATLRALTPLTYTFTADSTTAAGPRYAQLSLCVWDYGDGTPTDTAWATTHTFAASDPVRVRCTVVNNLFCTNTTDLLPFGPLGLPQNQVQKTGYVLGQNHPNPFNSETRITYQLPAASADARVEVCDLTGRLLRTVMLTEATGEVTVQLTGLPAGIYVYRLVCDGVVQSARRMATLATY